MSRITLKLLNGIYGWVISTIILTSSIYAVYSIWDNSQIYQAAEDVQNEIRKLKPVEGTEEQGPGFDELRAINEDVVGWITVDNTNIDYPVLQGDTNLTYMDKDVFGEYSLAGSIFLDIRNNADFSDNYSLIYGHNMNEHLMFGDIALFKDHDFFEENNSATLMMPDGSREMGVAAVLQIPAGVDEIFNPYHWRDSLEGLAEYLEKESIWFRKSWLDKLKKHPDNYDIVTLVTCSSGSTNSRSVLVLIHEKKDISDEPTKPDDGDEGDIGTGDPSDTGDHTNLNLWIYLLVGSLAVMVTVEILDRKKKAL